MTQLAMGRVRVAAATGPEIGATATVALIVREADCASALKLSDDPRDNFPAVFATTRMIALMELAGARFLHPLLQPGEMSVGAHVDVSHTARRQSAPASRRRRLIADATENLWYST